MTVVDLASRRPSVRYTVRITQGWDGSLAVAVDGLADDKRSRSAVADALRIAASLIDRSCEDHVDG